MSLFSSKSQLSNPLLTSMSAGRPESSTSASMKRKASSDSQAQQSVPSKHSVPGMSLRGNNLLFGPSLLLTTNSSRPKKKDGDGVVKPGLTRPSSGLRLKSSLSNNKLLSSGSTGISLQNKLLGAGSPLLKPMEASPATDSVRRSTSYQSNVVTKPGMNAPSLLGKEPRVGAQSLLGKHRMEKASQSCQPPKKVKSRPIAQEQDIDIVIDSNVSTCELPTYNFSRDVPKVESVVQELPLFDRLETVDWPGQVKGQVANITAFKQRFINAVSASLIGGPDFHNRNDAIKSNVTAQAKVIISQDPEFILKVALYTRKELNIRTTANFLLALASMTPDCRPYLRKYFSTSVALPSDWIDVAELYQTFHDKNINYGSLPSALRKAMTDRFPKFDQYQLAKYNKDKSKKKKKPPAAPTEPSEAAKGEGHVESQEDDGSHDEGHDSDTDEEEMERLSFTLKQLIRKLHIKEPVDSVMALLGKKYPEDLESFYQSHLSGTWDPERAGKRMKLPTPETWETQISLKGNKAPVWEQLIDNKKLPFMAMLRNLRNMIQAGIGEKHHKWVLYKLTDHGSVVNSKQFPFRFFSAYEILNALETDLDKAAKLKEHGKIELKRNHGGKKENQIPKWKQKKMEKKLSELPYDINKLNRYRKALDTAVKIATRYNVKPIPGKTLLLCKCDESMDKPCTSARGLGKKRTVLDVGVLLGLMCKFSCEDCTMVLFDGDNRCSVDLEPGTILQNMENVLKLALGLRSENRSGKEGRVNPVILTEILRDRTELDNLVILGDGCDQGGVVDEFLAKYRHLVNENLLFVNVDLGGAKCTMSTSTTPKHPNDIHIAGYSDQILRFIAERGDTGQVTHVQNIDKAYNLSAIKVTTGKKAAVSIPDQITPLLPTELTRKQHNLRVFISSTFRDMHGERDLLTRFVFPELRAKACTRFVNLYEVDLRWGVNEEQTKLSSNVEICLREANRCDLFLGMLGDRYGYIPDAYPDLSDDPAFNWLSSHPRGRSITELEFYHKALRLTEPDGKAFFYIRDSAFIQDLPGKLRSQFVDESDQRKEKLTNLKNTITTSGYEVFNGYPCKFGGIVEGKAVVVNLEAFGRRVINNVWNHIQQTYPQDGELLDEVAHERAQHDMYLQSQLATFTGRRSQMKQSVEAIQKTEAGIILISGKMGCGKTALMASIADHLQKKSIKSSVLVHFIGAVSGSSHVVPLLRRLSHELVRRCSLQKQVPEEYKNLVSEFPHLLEEAATRFDSSNKLVIVIDGISNMDPTHQAHNLDWLPHNIPQNVVFVFSTVSATPAHQAAVRRQPTLVELGPLDLLDKAEVVRKTLAAHHKTLDESPFNNQMKLLVSKREANLPLFLKLACEELRVFGVFEEVSARLKAMSHTIASLLQEVLKRLENDHGQDVISTALALLVSSRDGLLEEDLHHLLSIHSKLGGTKYTYSAVRDTTLSPGALLPQALMARLIRGIRSLLAPTGEHGDHRLKVSHGQISQAIVQRYMKGAASELQMRTHSLLAGYYSQLGQPSGPGGSWSPAPTHALRELPYHLVQAGLFNDLQVVLTDPLFIQAKCLAGLTPSLLDDLQADTTTKSKALLRDREKFLSNPLVASLRSFISRHLHILNLCPSLLWQQALNEPDASPVRQAMMESGDGGGVVAWKNKKETVDECSMTLTGFTEAVLCVAIAPGDACFAVGTKDCQLKLYDMATGKELKTFTGHSDAVTSCCFVGRSRLVSASKDNNLSLWDVDQGFRVTIMKGHKRQVSSCIADPKGVNVASCGWDCRVLVWDGRSGKLTTDIKEPRPVSCISYHPEGKLLVTGSWDCTLKIWDTFSKKRVAILRGHLSSVRAVKYSPSGRHIASASLDGAVKLWSADTGTQVGSLCGHSQPINHIAYSHNGRELVTVSNDHKIKVWSGNLGKQLVTFRGQGEKNAATHSIFSQDGAFVAMGYHSGEVKVMEVGGGEQEVFSCHYKESRVNGLAWVSGSKDHLSLLMGFQSGHAIMVFNVLAREPFTIELKPCHSSVTAVAFTGKGKIAAVCYENMSVALWQNPKVEGTGKKGSTSILEPTSVLYPKCNGVITCCSFNTPGTKLVIGTRDAMLIVYGMDGKRSKGKNKEPLLQLNNCHKDWINALAWSRHTEYIATGSNDSTIKLWDMSKEGKVKAHLKGHQGAVYAVAIMEGCVVSGSLDGSVKVWTHRGVEITTLYGHSSKVNCVDIYVPDDLTDKFKEVPDLDEDDGMGDAGTGGNWGVMATMEEWSERQEKKKLVRVPTVKMEEFMIASASDDGTAQLWKPLEGNELATLTGHSDRVLSVAIAASGQLVTTSLDRTVKLWNTKLSPDLVQFGVHGAEIVAVACSPETNRAITTSRNGMVCLWQLGDSNKDTGYLTLLYSWKLQESTANAACFVGKNSKFVLGLDNGHISRWEVRERKGKPGSYFTVEVKNHNLNSKVGGGMATPVTCMTYDDVKDTLYVGTWVSLFTLQKLTTGKIKQTDRKMLDWVLDVQQAPDHGVIAALANGTVVSCKQGEVMFEAGRTSPQTLAPWQYTVTVIPEQHGNLGGSDLLTGNSSGEVVHVACNKKQQLAKKLKAAVTSLKLTNRHVVSAAADGTVKFWDRDSFKQVGQFFCSSPLTAMSIQSASSSTVLCGDRLGYVYLLEWIQ